MTPTYVLSSVIVRLDPFRIRTTVLGFLVVTTDLVVFSDSFCQWYSDAWLITPCLTLSLIECNFLGFVQSLFGSWSHDSCVRSASCHSKAWLILLSCLPTVMEGIFKSFRQWHLETRLIHPYSSTVARIHGSSLRPVLNHYSNVFRVCAICSLHTHPFFPFLVIDRTDLFRIRLVNSS